MRPLLHIGYHKTGTTLLQRRVFPDAEAGFCFVAGVDALQPAFVDANPFDFDPEAAREAFEPGIREAQAQALVPVLSYERLSGGPHSGGYDSKTIADRLITTFPDARVLMVVREQTSMLISLYKVYVRMGGVASFEQYINPPPHSAARAPLFRFDYLEYHRLVGYYQGLFGAENVLVLPYELLERRPRAFVRSIGEFVEAPAARAKLKQVNTSPSALTLSIKRHANKWLVRSPLNVAPVLPIHLPNEPLKRLTSRADRKLPEALRIAGDRRWRRLAEHHVGDRYAESNTLTTKLTNLELRTFGYAC